MDIGSFVIGIIVGVVVLLMISIGIFFADPYTSIEDVCYDQTFTPQEYEECLRNLRGR